MALTRPFFGRDHRPAPRIGARLRRTPETLPPADALTCPRCTIALSVAGPSDRPYWVCPLCEGVRTR